MEKIIATLNDKTGQRVVIKYTDSLVESPVTPVFLKLYSELIQAGHATSSMAGHNACHAIYAEIDNNVVGHIVFDVLRPSNSTWIILSGIDPAFRKRGIYSLMHRQFEDVTIRLGCNKIQSHVHINNVDRIASCKAVGMEPEFFKMSKILPLKK